jgi:hypothetical protein
LGDEAGRELAKIGYAFATIALSAFWSMIRADFAPVELGVARRNQEI